MQGCWQEHEINKFIGSEPCEFEITYPENMETLKKVSSECGYSWSPEVVRIIFDRGSYQIIDIEGELEPPQKEQTPDKTIMAYGSSITHGSNAIDASHAWTAVLAHNLNMDVRNLGMAGNCRMEPEMMDYIAREGEEEKWDIATLELGINVLGWEEQKINERVENAIGQVASRNPQKPVFVISPMYCHDDFYNGNDAAKWRRLIENNVNKLNLSNVKYINGLDLLGDMSLLCTEILRKRIMYGCL